MTFKHNFAKRVCVSLVKAVYELARNLFVLGTFRDFEATMIKFSTKISTEMWKLA